MAKRGNGEGSIRQKPNGRWEGRVGLPNGDRVSVSAGTRREVQEKIKRAREEAERGIDVRAGREPLADFLNRWLRDVVAPHRSTRTYDSYEEIVRVHIVPTLGTIKLNRIRAHDIDKLLAAKLAQGKSPRTVQLIRSVLVTALERAYRWRLVPENIAKLTDSPIVRTEEVEPLTIDQAKAFLRQVEGDRLEALYRVAIFTGMRQGEILGLRWSDVDLDAGEASVQQSLTRYRGTFLFKAPKTEKSRRTLVLPPNVVECLQRHRTAQKAARLAYGPQWQCPELVFTSTVGGPVDAGNLLRFFKGHLKKAGLPVCRFHDLRHTAASMLIAQGLQLPEVSRVMGHSQISTTMDIYGHMFPETYERAAALMELMLVG